LLNPDRVYPGIKEVEKKEAKKVSPWSFNLFYFLLLLDFSYHSIP
jgi:hypothetical protein